MNSFNETICVVGIWHLGIVNAIGFAEKGYKVIGLDFDNNNIKKLQKGIPPLYEPGLENLLRKYLNNGQLIFSNDMKLIGMADYVVIAYDSSINDKDEVDITAVQEAATTLAPYIKSDTPLIITSQVPLGSSEKIEEKIRAINSQWHGGVVYTPENLRLGTALECFLKPDMIVLGSSSASALKATQQLYQSFDAPKIVMNLRSAEMVKHALNAFLATSIAFGNEIANIADRLSGIDAVAVANALKFDRRINKAPILPGLGFSGGTLARDITQLQRFSKALKYRALLIESIIKINEDTFDEIVLKLKNALVELNGKTIGILGLTYKPGTSTMRRSPAIKIIQKLVNLKVRCLGYDPYASTKEFTKYKKIVTRVSSIEELAKLSDALVLITEWPEFKKVDYKRIAKLMTKRIFVDTKNFLDPKQLSAAGFYWEGYGRKGGNNMKSRNL